MASKFQAPRGTFDVLPEQAVARTQVERRAAEILGRAGYQPISTPIFEDTDLFVRGVGRSTDIVQKEMFTFEDKGERSLTLRPEGTAPICRAYLEHGMRVWAQPVKLSYGGSFFRHERPQAGRFRQFNQIGVEAIGSASPYADAEVIVLLSELLEDLEVPDVELRLGSLGSFGVRVAYLERLSAYLEAHSENLSQEVRERVRINPLRAFDSKDEGTRAVMAEAPRIVESLVGDDADHFSEVRSALEAAGIEYSIDPTLVRGLDYYTRTIFSFNCGRLGAQSEIGGGGRYDGLIEQLGGPPTPAVGWAVGIERILLALGEGHLQTWRNLFIVATAPGQQKQAMALAREVRQAGFSVEVDLGGRGVNGQIKHADRIGARWALILKDDGSSELRDMAMRAQEPVDYRRIVEVLQRKENV